MPFDFSKFPLKNRAFSEKPMTFIDEDTKYFLASIIDLVAIEKGNRKAREHWQHKQLQNLLQHAAQNSSFWRKRIGTKNIKKISLSDLPVLTRADVAGQVESEGSLLPSGGPINVRKMSTSGSSGTPVQFFVSEMNTQHNAVRTIAQYFIEGRDLTLNRTCFSRSPKRIPNGFSVERSDNSLGPLSSLFKCGNTKDIRYINPNRDLLLGELAKDPIGYLVIQPAVLESLLLHTDVSFFSEHGTKMLIPTDEEADKDLRAKLSAAGIPVRSVYSSQECGYIGTECEECAGAFHVAESNVIVEIDNQDGVIVGDRKLGRVLVTQLHSYATPFVRYDIGDFAQLSDICRCGHDGPALTNLYGRKKRLLKRVDGTVTPFSVTARNILRIVKCDEYRIRQTGLNIIEVVIGGITQLNGDQIASLNRLFKERAGDEFEVHINAVQNIDWGSDTKRLGFRSEVV